MNAGSGGSGVQPAETGVFYSPEDVAGLVRRVFVVLVDLTVVSFLCAPLVALAEGAGISSAFTAAGVFLVAWAYLAWLKVTRFRTIGYRLAHVELVDLQGDRATVWRATLRFLFFFFTLGNLIDLVLLSHDPERQTLRDKLVGTYVIRKGARPVGSGPISYPSYFLGGMSLVLPEVDGADESASTRPEQHTDS